MRSTCSAHHPDIMRFLDTKRENADEKIRIKTLSLGVVVPDITFELAKKGEDMYLFSPYDVEKVYGVPFGDISVSEKYHEMVDDAADQEDEDQGARLLPDARRDPVRVRLPVHHVRGHGEQGEPDQGPHQHVEPLLGDPAGQHPDDLQRRPVVRRDRQGHLLQPRFDEHRPVDGLARLRPHRRDGHPWPQLGVATRATSNRCARSKTATTSRTPSASAR